MSILIKEYTISLIAAMGKGAYLANNISTVSPI